MFLELISLLDEKLECGPCADVLVQVDDPALLAANEGEIDPVKLQTFLKGTIKEFTIVADKFNCRYYQYTIEYDDEQLAEGVTGIDECQVVKICCANCLIDYVDEQFIDEATIASLIDNGDNTFTFDNGLGDTTTIDFAHSLSEPVDGTVRLTRPNGTFDEVDVSVTVTPGGPLSGTGTAADPLDFLISADVGNDIILGSDDGIYLNVPAAPGETITTLVDNGDNTFTYTSEDATITTFDAAHTLQSGAPGVIRLVRPDATFDDVDVTVNADLPLQGTGAPASHLTVLLSADAGNVIVLGTDSGLYANSPTTVVTTLPILGDGSGGNPVDLLISADGGNNIVLGTDSGIYANTPITQFAIQGDGSVGSPIEIFFSGDADNQAQLGTDNGLFVPPPSVTVSLPIIGDGLAGNPIDLLFSVDVGNIATTGSDGGIYVPTAGSTVTTSLPITGDGSGGSPVDLLISVDAGNQITLGGDGGVYVAPETVFVALPIVGDGSVGSPIDLLISVDAGNQITTGGDGGVYVAPETIVTAFPIIGDGSAGSPVDLLISVDAGNELVIGSDNGLYAPAVPNPGILRVVRNAAESDNNGDGTTFGIRRQAMGPAATTESTYLFQVPESWDSATNVEINARYSNNSAGDGDIRFQWGIAAFANGEVLDAVDDQTITFSENILGAAANTFTITTVQSISAANLAVGDFLRLTLRRLGADILDTQSGTINLYQVQCRFSRVNGNFQVTT